jgi:spore coat polysaccharide biosynthesis protein SpsF
MKNNFKTQQEKFWLENFGNQYIDRNGKSKNRILQIGNALKKNKVKIASALELGCNVGYNLDALKKIYNKIDLNGVEINLKAYKKVKKKYNCYNESILNFDTSLKYDLVFTSGVLIHVNPKYLNKVYEKIYNFSKKYIYIQEYFNPVPIEVKYRGHKGKLFKRDFAKEIKFKYKNLKIIDYGFFWKEDPIFKGNCDNSNWFLFKK